MRAPRTLSLRPTLLNSILSDQRTSCTSYLQTMHGSLQAMAYRHPRGSKVYSDHQCYLGTSTAPSSPQDASGVADLKHTRLARRCTSGAHEADATGFGNQDLHERAVCYCVRAQALQPFNCRLHRQVVYICEDRTKRSQAVCLLLELI